MTEYDAVVIGSGQAGNPLAHTLADEGWRVALVERGFLGGSCVNWGCTPTKTLVASAQAAYDARRAGELGIEVGAVRVDFDAVMARKQRMVEKWREGQQSQVERRPSLTLIRGEARFVAERTIEVEGERIRAPHIFINTGTRGRIPPIEGIDDVPVMTNREILQLETLPEHLIVLGGSYIGLEFGQMFRRFGSRVTVIEHNDRIIPREDPDISDALQDILELEGIEFHLGVEAERVTRDGEGVRLVLGGDGTAAVTGSHLLVATGRVPNTDRLDPAAAGVQVDQRGYIQVNERLESSAGGIWALGDVKGGPAFTHISYNDHQIVLENLLRDGSATISGRLVPYALFTDPPLGRVGMSETAARAAGHDLLVGAIPMERVARAMERGDTRGRMKVVIDARTEQILGAAVLGTEGGELVQSLMIHMRAGAPWHALRGEVYIHPTLTEGFFALFESVEPG